ncbi:MAG TPA: DUF421 domain-containing protein [Pseudogracilibacillus sp.]|nr:DUF421 domain-containing protein [Pseudogracilibacillus sp.]
MTNLFPMFYETLFGITALFILTKLLGKTQISQLTAFDFIAAIVLGELVGNALFDKEAGIKEIGFVILVWGVILYIIEMITQKFKGSRFLLEGKPALIIHKGELIYEEMRKNKIDINEVQQLLRGKDVFAIQEVEYAILETNGEISVLKKSQFDSPTREDMKIVPTKAEMAFTLINDGEIIHDNLEEIDRTETWLQNELRKQNFEKVEDVFYAEYTKDKPLFIQPYIKIKHKDYKKKKQ